MNEEEEFKKALNKKGFFERIFTALLGVFSFLFYGAISICLVGGFWGCAAGIAAGAVSWLFGSDDPHGWAQLWGVVMGVMAGFIGFIKYIINVREAL